VSPSRLALCLVLVLAGGALKAQEPQEPEEPPGQEQAVQPAPQSGSTEQPKPSQPVPAVEPGSKPLELYPSREVERPLLLSRGLFELRSNFSYLSADEFFNEHGESEKPPRDYELFSGKMGLGHGTFDWLELGAEIPFFSGREVYAKGQGIGDLSGYALFRVYQSGEKGPELALRLRLSAPTGEPDRTFDLKNEQLVQSNIRTGDPSVDIFPALAAQWSGKKFAVRGSAEYGWRLAGNIKTGIEGLENTRNFEPGPSLEIKLDFLCQLADKWAPFASLGFFSQDANKLEGENLDDARQLLLFSPGVQYQPGRDYDFWLQAGVPISGKNFPNGYPLSAGIRGRF